MDPTPLIGRLTEVVGGANVLTDRDVEGYTTDPRSVPGPAPMAVVRPATTGEVAEVVGFLFGEGAGYVTGQVIAVNGGIS